MERKDERKNEPKRLTKQFIRFVLVGILNTAVDFIVFQVLNLLFELTYLAQVIGYCCGIVNSYAWNSNWTFREERTRSLREIVTFLAVNLVSLGVSLGTIWLCKNVFLINDAWTDAWLPTFLQSLVNGDTVCKLIATPVAIVVNFLGNRLFVFKRS